MENDDEQARNAALSLIARGIINPAEAAALLAVNRVTVFRWCRAAGIAYKAARRSHVAQQWQLAMNQPDAPRIGSRKQRARHIAEAAVKTYTQQGNKIKRLPLRQPATPHNND